MKTLGTFLPLSESVHHQPSVKLPLNQLQQRDKIRRGDQEIRSSFASLEFGKIPENWREFSHTKFPWNPFHLNFSLQYGVTDFYTSLIFSFTLFTDFLLMLTLQQTIGGGGTLGRAGVFIPTEVARIRARAYVQIVLMRRWLWLARLATAYQSPRSAHEDNSYLSKMASREFFQELNNRKIWFIVWITQLSRHLVS